MSFTVYGEHPGSGGHWEFARKTAAEPSSRPLISSAMDGRAFTFRMIKSKIFCPDRFDQLYPVSNPNA